jgi:hypothetical protein
MVQPGVSALGKKNRTTGLPRNCFKETGFPFSSGKVNSGALSLSCMVISPLRRLLYRRARVGVIPGALILLMAGALWAQFAQKNAVSKGPRAIGLLSMPAKGKPRLIPVAIMVDGRFYDAGAYKADPVPMALEQGTVYEAQRSGNSLGLFTVGQVLQQKNNWLAEGTYHANGEVIASKTHTAETKPREDKDEGPPILHRPGSAPAKPATPTPESKPNTTAPAPAATAGPAKVTSEAQPSPAPKPEPPPEDPNIPKLRRGVPETSSTKEDQPNPAPSLKASTANKTPANVAGTNAGAQDVQLVPAISDANGPEPRPFTYDMKPDEEQAFRTKILAMAADELRKQAREFQVAKPASATRPRPGAKRTSPKAAQPTFDDVQLRVFDLSSSNEPILVLTATAHPPKTTQEQTTSADYYVTLVARSDIYDELRKLFSAITDSQHLDVTPRIQLVDAVDADGDNRGELLFREISDAGSAYLIYRVTPDRLWPLYEGTAQ